MLFIEFDLYAMVSPCVGRSKNINPFSNKSSKTLKLRF